MKQLLILYASQTGHTLQLVDALCVNRHAKLSRFPG